MKLSIVRGMQSLHCKRAAMLQCNEARVKTWHSWPRTLVLQTSQHDGAQQGRCCMWEGGGYLGSDRVSKQPLMTLLPV